MHQPPRYIFFISPFFPPQCSVRHNALRSRLLFAKLYSYIYIHTHMHACIHTYYICIYIYWHTHTHWWWRGCTELLCTQLVCTQLVCVLSSCVHWAGAVILTLGFPVIFFFSQRLHPEHTHTHTHTIMHTHTHTHTHTHNLKGWSLTRWSPQRSNKTEFIIRRLSRDGVSYMSVLV